MNQQISKYHQQVSTSIFSGILYISHHLSVCPLNSGQCSNHYIKPVDILVPLVVLEALQCYLKAPSYCHHFESRLI